LYHQKRYNICKDSEKNLVGQQERHKKANLGNTYRTFAAHGFEAKITVKQSFLYNSSVDTNADQ